MSVGTVTQTPNGVVIHKEQNTIHIDKHKGIVTKQLGRRPSSGNKVTIAPEWLEAYKVFQTINPYVVKVYEITKANSFTMEYVPNIGTVDEWLKDHSITRLELFELTRCIMSVIPSSIDMSKVLDTLNEYGKHSMWVNTDFHVHNVVCIQDGDDPKFKIIDPDSWWIWNNANHSQSEFQPHPLDQLKRMNTMVTNVVNDLRA